MFPFADPFTTWGSSNLKLIISVNIPYTGETGVEGPTAGEMQMILQWGQKMLSPRRSRLHS